MAVNFGLLQPAAPVSAFFQGQQDVRAEADRNMLRQAQAEQRQFERENMLAQRSDREAQAKLRGQQELELRSRMERAAREEGYLNKVSELFANNGMPLNLKTAQEGLSYAIKSGDKNAIDMMNRTVASLQEREALQAAFGGQAAPAAAPSMMRQPPAVAAPAAAPTNMFAGTIADIGTTQPAPVNALAAPPQLTAPAAGAMSREYLQSIILNPNAPPAAVARAKAVLESLPKDQPGARLQDRFVPVGKLVFDRQAQQFITPPAAAIAATQDRAAAAPKEPAPPKPLTAQQETQRRDKLGKEFKTAVNALQTTQDVLDSLQNVKDAPGLNRATGYFGVYAPSIPEGAAAQAEVRFQNLKGKVTALGKAQAASTGAIGSIANQEWKILADQIAALELVKGTGPLLEQLDLVEAQAQGAMERIRDAYQRQFGEDFERFPQFKDLPAPKSTVKGRKSGGPVTPATPAAPAPPLTAAEQTELDALRQRFGGRRP